MLEIYQSSVTTHKESQLHNSPLGQSSNTFSKLKKKKVIAERVGLTQYLDKALYLNLLA